MHYQTQSKRFIFKPVVLAVHLALCSGVVLINSEALAETTQQNSYNIAAGSLNVVLNQFAAQSGIAVVMDGKQIAQLKSNGLQGTYSIEQGFAAILQNTSLQAQKTNTGYVITERNPTTKQSSNAIVNSNNSTTAANTNVAHLPVIVVTAETDPSDESKNNYGVSRSSSATKLDLSLKDTPQSITIITQKQIEEQNLQNVNDVLEATPGVTVQNYGVPGAGRANYYSRGYEINNVMVDGAPTLISGLRGMEVLAGMDTVIYDRVEITRGSSGLSTGTGDPSASLNFVRKRPSMEAQRSAKISYGRWDKKRVELDVSQPFTSDASIRGRFVAAYGQGDSYIDRIKEESKILYGIVEADLGDKTTIALGGTWSDKDVDDASPHMTSSASDNSASLGTFDGGRNWNAATDWSYSHQRNWNGFFTVNHSFNDNWKLSTNYQYTRATPDRLWGVIGSSWYNQQYNTASYTIGREKDESKVHNLDISLLGKFELFGREAQIATGINGYQSKAFDPVYGSYVRQRCTHGTRIIDSCYSLDAWNNGAIPYPENTRILEIMTVGQYPLDFTKIHYDRKEKQYGYFFSTKFEPIQDLKVILGTRYNHYNIDVKYENNLTPTKTYSYTHKPKDKWIPYAGLVYDINDQLSAYASYTGIYKTQLEKDINDQFLPFVEGNSYELGLKSALFDDKLNLATAIFQMKEENIAYYYQDYPINSEGKYYTCTPVTGNLCDVKYSADGPTISGFEITAQGQLTDKWLINAGYTYLHVNQPVSGIDKNYSPSMSSGDYSFQRPKHAINLSTSYQLFDQLTLGGSLRWKSNTIQEINLSNVQAKEQGVNDILSQGSYTILDLMARYKVSDNIITGININNLLDKVYRSNDRGSLYGQPRSATLSVNFKF